MSKKIGIKLTKQSVMDNITKYISAIFIVVLLVLLTATQDNFLGSYNLKNLLRDPAPLMLMASGMGMVLLIVEGAPAEEIEELYDFYNEVGLPTTFADLGVADVTDEELMKVAETSMHSYWDVEPFTVNPQMVFDGLKMADILGRRMK